MFSAPFRKPPRSGAVMNRLFHDRRAAALVSYPGTGATNQSRVVGLDSGSAVPKSNAALVRSFKVLSSAPPFGASRAALFKSRICSSVEFPGLKATA